MECMNCQGETEATGWVSERACVAAGIIAET